MSEVKKSGHSHHQRGRFSGKIGYVLAVAGGRQVCSERNGYHDMAIFKTGVTAEECSCWFISC